MVSFYNSSDDMKDLVKYFIIGCKELFSNKVLIISLSIMNLFLISGIIYKEINNTQQAVKKVIGEEPKLFRPPYRAISKAMCNIVKEKDMNIVLWSNLDPRDWSNPGVYYIVDTITSKVQNGTIILLHDYNNLRNKKSQTVQALEIVIPKLKEMGYKFVTVSELIENLEKEQTMQKQ